jgi:hypothetical protein
MTERTRARHGQVALDRGERNGGHRSFPAPLKGAADRRSRDLRGTRASVRCALEYQTCTPYVDAEPQHCALDEHTGAWACHCEAVGVRRMILRCARLTDWKSPKRSADSSGFKLNPDDAQPGHACPIDRACTRSATL